MKVLQIPPELNEGGMERGTLEIGRYLVQQSHEALVVPNGGRVVTALELAGIRHIIMPVHRKLLSALFQIAPLRLRNGLTYDTCIRVYVRTKGTWAVGTVSAIG